jgi:hypothetical protein
MPEKEICMVDSNRRTLTSLSQITDRFRSILKSASYPNLRSMADLWNMIRAYVSDVIVRRFEKVGNRHRFEN